MSNKAASISIEGIGAVSPAGWNVAAMREALCRKEALPVQQMERPGWDQGLKGALARKPSVAPWSSPLQVRKAPPPKPRPAFMTHPRLRRSSPISQFAVAAALEALGEDAVQFAGSNGRLGIVFCAMSGCVNYSRRFYDETLQNPATASPLVFPETVFNAPASHLAALLQTTAINYTLVGDPGTFLQGLAVGAEWVAGGQVEGCLVIGAEESDWLTADACRHFSRDAIMAEGAGAVYLRSGGSAQGAVELCAITDAHLYLPDQTPRQAARRMRAQLPPGRPGHLLCDGLQGAALMDAAETAAWQDWKETRLSPKTILGEGMIAAAAWQCIAAIDALREDLCSAATVSVVGCNEQAIGAHFALSQPGPARSNLDA